LKIASITYPELNTQTLFPYISCPDPPENCHLNIKKLPKNCPFFWQFFWKNGKFWAIFWHSNGNFPDGQILSTDVLNLTATVCTQWQWQLAMTSLTLDTLTPGPACRSRNVVAGALRNLPRSKIDFLRATWYKKGTLWGHYWILWSALLEKERA